MNRFLSGALFSLILGALAHPVLAGEWALRLEGGVTDYSRQAFTSYFQNSSELSFDGGTGFALSGEYRPGRVAGFEFSIGLIELDARWRATQLRPISFNPPVFETVVLADESGDFTVQPMTFGLLLHPLRDSRFDLYVGPQVGWAEFDLGVNGPPRREGEVVIGGKVGMEMQLARSPWSAGLSYRYVETQHEGHERDVYTGIGLHLVSAVISRKGLAR